MHEALPLIYATEAEEDKNLGARHCIEEAMSALQSFFSRQNSNEISL